MSRFAPISPAALGARLVAEFDRRQLPGQPLRVALDRPSFLDLTPLLQTLEIELPALGHPVAVVPATGFFRDASLRYEYGKQDVESFYSGWLDSAALEREVLTPVVKDGTFLPSLRDPATNRATRVQPDALGPNGVLVVVGEMLLGAGLNFDVTVYATMSRLARRRLAPAELQWQLPAWDRYDSDVDPSGFADIVVRFEDPRRPAIRESR